MQRSVLINVAPNSPTTSANFSFCPFFLFCLRFVSQFEGKNTITGADLHFGSDKEIKLGLWPHYHRISWLFIAIFMPPSPPSSSWCRQMWQPFVANISNCCNWPWLKINKLLIFFPLKREKGRWMGKYGEKNWWTARTMCSVLGHICDPAVSYRIKTQLF